MPDKENAQSPFINNVKILEQWRHKIKMFSSLLIILMTKK